uniref:TPR_REGION domain-containing protein n=1 Tax=Caenorhabditis tropicalis TaxID=1561998 RepID=A0A1I7TYS6_9PELO
MGTLKEDLKAAQGLLKTGDNEKVIELLEGYTEGDSPDYRVLCFIALAHSNISNYEESYKLYKKAVDVDEAQLMAWKGLFKLFDEKSCTKPDKFSLRICEFMQKNGDDEKKREIAAKAQRRLLIEMEMWEEVFNHFDDFGFAEDFENLRDIVVRAEESCDKAVQKAFDALAALGRLEEDESVMLSYCKHTKSEQSLVRLIEVHPNLISDDWVQKNIFEYSCQQYFDSKQFPPYAEHINCASSSTMAVVTALRKMTCQQHLKHLMKLPTYPFIQIVYYLALLEIEPESVEKLQALGSLPLPEFVIEELKVALLSNNEETVEKLLTEYKEDSRIGIILRLTKALNSNDSITAELVNLSEKLSNENYKDLLLAAEIRIRAGLDGNSHLVKAAKLNVRCSRAFFLLGNCLATKNATKAKSLIERAILIRPANEEYTKALYDILVRKGFPTDERLKLLKSLISKKRNRRKSFWLSHALSLIYMETGNLTDAIDELQQMIRLYKDNKSIWARLADAYTRKGHLRAAVSSYAQLAEMDGGHEFVIPITRVLIQLREFDEALDKIIEFRKRIEDENLDLCPESPVVLNLTEAEIRLNLHESTCGEQKLHHLKKVFDCLKQCLDAEGSCQYASVFKLLGDAFLVASKYSERTIPYFEFEAKWKVHTPLDSVSKAVSFYMAVLRSQNNNPLAWYDVAVSLISKFNIEKDAQILPKVQKILEHALSITSVDTLLSSIWTLIAETKRLAEAPASHQLHCICRALQLNKSNDGAWLKLAVLCLEVGMMNEASRSLEQSIKYNPHNAYSWCAWAQVAHLQGESHEAIAMFRQALFVRPITTAIVGYSTYLCDNLKKSQHRFNSATAALDFEPIIDLKNLASADQNILYHLGLLADLFGWYPESLECFRLSGSPKITDEIQHAMVKTDVLYNKFKLDPATLSQNSSRICGMLALSADDCYSFLTAEMDVYRDLYRFIESNDSEAFRKLYLGCVKGISVPLFIAGLIVRKINLPSEFIRIMHDALPRHELIDYYPTELPHGMDNGLRHLEQDGEEPFRYRHRCAYSLLDELKLLRSQLEEDTVNSSSSFEKIEVPDCSESF